jgi:hypothetical protein
MSEEPNEPPSLDSAYAGAHRSALPLRFRDAADAVLRRALRSYLAEQKRCPALVPKKLEILRHYDVPQMEHPVAICPWSRSGSILLASYLDGHNDVIALPNLTGQSIYPFFQDYDRLSLWEKLLAYPAYSESKRGNAGNLFLKNNPAGDYATPAADYYAAVQALFAAYGRRPAMWLGTRQRFFQFLHAAYAVANGQRPDIPQPVMIYAQHSFNDDIARQFMEDFPAGRFIHTVRDPISGLDSWFEWNMIERFAENQNLASKYAFPAYDALYNLLACDRAHRGAEARSYAIRFEDLHLALATTMRRLATWLGIPYRPSLLESTLNGNPYVVKGRGGPWTGPNPANARRRAENLHVGDRLMIFALLHRNFDSWNYPSPKIFGRRWVRLCVLALFGAVPMKMEVRNAREILRLQALPALRNGRIGFACLAPLLLIKRRIRTMLLIATEAHARETGRRQPIRTL